MRAQRNHKCQCCCKQFSTRNKNPKFCSLSCAATHNNHRRFVSDEQKRKVSERLQQYWKDHPEKRKQADTATQKGKHKKPSSILELSKRTVSKICYRLNIECSSCGWDKEICDIHHIIPRGQGGSDDHSNLAYLCPNCHRLAHKGKLSQEDLIRLDQYIGDEWKDYYYG